MYRWSKLFIPTLREAPADAEVASHKFLFRAGYIRQVAAGVYSYLFLGQRSINKIQAIVRQEMDRIAQEFLLPALHPRELWEESGRWTVMGQNLFKLQDRKGAWLVLGMTEEEVMTDIARKELRSYKQLPQIWYQIQAKFRDEPRPRAGLLRVRQFIMKDSYSFDLDAAGLDLSYNKHDAAYRAIFNRSGLNFVAVQADSGAMGGSQSQEFMVYAEAGEDLIASCPACNYAANLEKATSQLPPAQDAPPVGNGTPELVHTPGRRTIEEVGALLELEAVHQIKTMAYMALTAQAKVGAAETASPVIVLLRGDHTLNLAKLAALFPGARELRPMVPEEILVTFHAPAGYLGVVGLDILAAGEEPEAGKVTVVLDRALEGRQNLVAGANREEYHLRNVTPGRDFIPTLTADVRNVLEGESCPQCPASPGSSLKVAKAIEVGHIFKLGYRYSDGMGVRVLDPGGKEVTPIMGCYGLGIERILTAAIEQNHDANGFWLARSIAPFDIVVTVTNMGDPNLAATAEQVARKLEDAGFDVLLDDRDERAGVKFKDADLVGIPYRINVGKKAAEGRLELVTRATASSQDVAIAEIAERVKEVVQ
jgi:prolyl-tRNA synthetase